MKKKLATLLTALTVFMAGVFGGVMAGCGDISEIQPGEVPAYNSDKKLNIGMWVGVPDKIVTYEGAVKVNETAVSDEFFLEKYQEIADAGFTWAFPAYEAMGDGSGTYGPSSYNMKALKAAHTVGIKQIIADDKLRQILLNAKLNVQSGQSREKIVADVAAIVKKYTDTEYGDALYGFMVKDEPGANMFENLGYAEEIFREAAPNLVFYVNLFPVVANGNQLSGVSDSTVRYKDYIAKWIASVQNNYISYDHYPLYGSGIDQTSFEASFLYNMDLMKSACKDEGANREVWTFLQSMSFGSKNRPLKSKADASMQALSAVAYGLDCIQWFCYCCPPVSDGATTFGNDACLDRNLQKTDTYDYVQAANLDIQAMMKYLGEFEWQGVALSPVNDPTENFAFLEDSDNVIKNDKTLTSFTSTQDAFAGVFHDKDGKPAYLAVNFTDPGKNTANTLNMTFKGYGGALIVKNGKTETVKLSASKLTLKLESGEGALVIPY